MLLKTIKKDRRIKLYDLDLKNIKSMYFGFDFTMQEIADKYKVTHQRVSQIIDINNTIKDRRKEDARQIVLKYKSNNKYYKKRLEDKIKHYRYKRAMIKKYGKDKAKA